MSVPETNSPDPDTVLLKMRFGTLVVVERLSGRSPEAMPMSFWFGPTAETVGAAPARRTESINMRLTSREDFLEATSLLTSMLLPWTGGISRLRRASGAQMAVGATWPSPLSSGFLTRDQTPFMSSSWCLEQ